MFGLSGVWKGDRRCRVARRKSQAAEAKGWILTTSINVQSVAFGQLAGAREDGAAASHGLGCLHCQGVSIQICQDLSAAPLLQHWV